MSGKIIDVSDNLNYNGDKRACDSNMKVYKDELYCAWMEDVSDSSSQIKIKKYDGISWSEVSSNLNYYSGYRAYDPDMCIYKGELYCVWYEGSKSQIKIKKYNGVIWANVSGNLNYNGNNHALHPNLQVYKDELYCIWRESNDSSGYQIKIKKYNGINWSNVSNNLNYDGNQIVAYPIMQVYKDELYCAWSEYNYSNSQIKIKKYNGTNWSNVSNNINYNGNQNAGNSRLQVYKDELYCIWEEHNGSNNQIKIIKYNGDIWTSISSNLNYDGDKSASWPTMQVYRDELYCIWDERNINGSNLQIKMKKYDGINWTNISDNLNYENKDAALPTLQVYRDELYCVWHEKSTNGSNLQIKMKKYTLLAEKVQKYLIKHNDKYFKLNDDKEIVEVENNDFKINGFNNIELITRELLENKFSDLKDIQLLMWTNDIEKNEATMTCELRNPYRPIDILKKNNNGICNILFKKL